MMFYVMIGFFMLLSWLVGRKLKSKFAEFSNMPNSSGLSGAEVAQQMLNYNRIYDVKIISVDGQLTDHYNPADKTINLSYDVYHGRNVSAAAVAAHETGHAVQHATAYSMLALRSQLVPVVNISSTLMNAIFWVSILASGVLHLFGMSTVFLIVIIAQAAITLFSLITLPVEFDASNRALIWLNQSGVTRGAEHQAATSALNWAAMTYVVSALAAVSTLLYYVMSFLGSRD